MAPDEQDAVMAEWFVESYLQAHAKERSRIRQVADFYSGSDFAEWEREITDAAS